jgi:hypothetical protein
MCVALLIAAISLFGGQADTIPEPLRIPDVLALPAPTVLLVMLYYLWRVRIRRTYRGNLGAGSHGETGVANRIDKASQQRQRMLGSSPRREELRRAFSSHGLELIGPPLSIE